MCVRMCTHTQAYRVRLCTRTQTHIIMCTRTHIHNHTMSCSSNVAYMQCMHQSLFFAATKLLWFRERMDESKTHYSMEEMVELVELWVSAEHTHSTHTQTHTHTHTHTCTHTLTTNTVGSLSQLDVLNLCTQWHIPGYVYTLVHSHVCQYIYFI